MRCPRPALNFVNFLRFYCFYYSNCRYYPILFISRSLKRFVSTRLSPPTFALWSRPAVPLPQSAQIVPRDATRTPIHKPYSEASAHTRAASRLLVTDACWSQARPIGSLLHALGALSLLLPQEVCGSRSQPAPQLTPTLTTSFDTNASTAMLLLNCSAHARTPRRSVSSPSSSPLHLLRRRSSGSRRHLSPLVRQHQPPRRIRRAAHMAQRARASSPPRHIGAWLLSALHCSLIF